MAQFSSTDLPFPSTRETFFETPCIFFASLSIREVFLSFPPIFDKLDEVPEVAVDEFLSLFFGTFVLSLIEKAWCFILALVSEVLNDATK